MKKRKKKQLLIVRHGLAGDALKFAETGQPDEARPLTKQGVQEFTASAIFLSNAFPSIELAVTSPYIRATQTADIFCSLYKNALRRQTSSVFRPSGPIKQSAAYIEESFSSFDRIVIFGHNPNLELLVSFFLFNCSESRIRLKKGSACLLEFSNSVSGGASHLRFLGQPRELQYFAELR